MAEALGGVGGLGRGAGLTEHRRAFVLGGGVAGLTAAFGLADRGFRVTLLESRPTFGGRAYSTYDRVFERSVDNGFHVMLGCYRAMRSLCRRLGTEGGFLQAPRLQMGYRFGDGTATSLSLSGLFVPLAMPAAVLRLRIGAGARLRALFGMASVTVGAPPGWTFAEWLSRRGQRGAPADVLWRPLCLAVMNCEPEEADARMFLATLREAFFGRARSAALWVPKKTWGELIGDPAGPALMAAGVEVRTSARVASLEERGGRVATIHLAGKGQIDTSGDDVVVSAMPWFALQRALGDRAPAAITRLQSAPIVTVYFDVASGAPPPDEGPVTALVGGSPFHFLLRTPGERAGRFALLSGGDRTLDGMSVADVTASARDHVARYYPGADLQKTVTRVRREQHATFIPDPATAGARPKPGRLAEGPANLYVCGDWTATGFPATLEGAARSSEQMLAAIR